MDKGAMELYYYMGSDKPVYDWLVKEGAKNKKEARKIMGKFLKKNPLSMDVVLPHLTVDGKDIKNGFGSSFVIRVLERFDK